MAGEDTRLAGINLVHELAHSALSSPRPWVYEGLAHFAEAVYREQQGGREAALDLLGVHRSAFLDAEKDAAASQKNAGQPLATTFDETYYRSKAAYVWWILRDMVGDDALKAAIRNYRAADDTETKYVQRLIEAAAKQDLAWFFDDWVYHDRGLPDFHVQSAHLWKAEPGTAGKQISDREIHTITLTIENLGAVGAEVPFTVRCEGSDTAKRLEVRAKSTVTTRVGVLCTPLEVVLNDGSVPESDAANNVFRFPASQ
jgi:aminopeptidase N